MDPSFLRWFCHIELAALVLAL
jgi:hypothetical protein